MLNDLKTQYHLIEKYLGNDVAKDFLRILIDSITCGADRGLTLALAPLIREMAIGIINNKKEVLRNDNN